MDSDRIVRLATRREMLQAAATVAGGGLLSRLFPDTTSAESGNFTENFNAIKPGPLPPGWVPITAGGFEGGSRKPGVWERDLYGVEFARKLECTPSADYRIVADPTSPYQSSTWGT